MAVKDEQGNWIDAAGNKVDPAFISPLDKKRDNMVETIINKVEKQEKALIDFKKKITEQLFDFIEFSAAKAGVQVNDGGNYSFLNYSGDRQVDIRVAKFISFDENLKWAKTLIDKCIEKWSEGANKNLKAIINDAFKANTKGQLDTNRILSLRKLEIEKSETDWHKAMELITQAITIVDKKTYILFRRRDVMGKWETIKLDFASL